MGLIMSMVLINSALAFEISEIMYNPEGTDTGREWVEINSDQQENMSTTRLVDHAGSHYITLYSGDAVFAGYAIIAGNPTTFLQEHPEYTGTLFQSSLSLSNTGETINITKNGDVLDSVAFTSDFANGNGKSLEKIDNEWQESEVIGGTPGYGAFGDVPEFGLIAMIIAMVGSLVAVFLLRQE